MPRLLKQELTPEPDRVLRKVGQQDIALVTQRWSFLSNDYRSRQNLIAAITILAQNRNP